MIFAPEGHIRPAGGFSRRPAPTGLPMLDRPGGWYADHLGTLVWSTIESAQYPDGSGEVGDQWHLSVTLNHDRPDATALDRVVCRFGLDEYEIDNHHPGFAQHLWIPVDPVRRVECECKSDETIIVEADGYAWTNPVDGPCRGCEFASTFASTARGRPCPLHATTTGQAT